MNIAALGSSICIADMTGDRPAIITKVFSNTTVEACGFMPLPETLKLVILHSCRDAAINAGLRDTGFHAYWPLKV
jgi:hypothetical protein